MFIINDGLLFNFKNILVQNNIGTNVNMLSESESIKHTHG